MKHLIVIVLACVVLLPISATAEATQGTTPSGRYNILGLTLGMTAKQAEAVITQRLHVHIGSGNDSYGVSPEPGVYVPGRPFVGLILVKAGKTKLNIHYRNQICMNKKGLEHSAQGPVNAAADVPQSLFLDVSYACRFGSRCKSASS